MRASILPTLLVLPLLLQGGPSASAADSRDALELELSHLNRTYNDAVEELPSVTVAGLAMRLSSPEHRVTLVQHRLRLEPAGVDLHRARLDLEFMGKGQVEVRVESNGPGIRLQDEVLAPRQSRRLEGKVKIQPGGEGYLVTPTELPRFMQVELRSDLVIRLVRWCEQMSYVIPLGAQCALFERAFSRAMVPLPPAGETYLLPYAELTAEERAALDAYLARNPR